MKGQLIQIWTFPDGRIAEMFVVSVDQSAALRMSSVVTPDHAADELAATLTKWALKVSILLPVSWKHSHSHFAIVLLETGSCLLIQDRNKVVFFSYVFRALTGHHTLICCVAKREREIL